MCDTVQRFFSHSVNATEEVLPLGLFEGGCWVRKITTCGQIELFTEYPLWGRGNETALHCDLYMMNNELPGLENLMYGTRMSSLTEED